MNLSIGDDPNEINSSGGSQNLKEQLLGSGTNVVAEINLEPDNDNGSLGGEPDVLEITDDNSNVITDYQANQKTHYIDNREQFLSNTHDKPKNQRDCQSIPKIELLSNDSNNFITL